MTLLWVLDLRFSTTELIVVIFILIVYQIHLAESQSETEQVASDAQDSGSFTTSTESGPAPTADSPAPSENTQPSTAHKANQGELMETRTERLKDNVTKKLNYQQLKWLVYFSIVYVIIN